MVKLTEPNDQPARAVGERGSVRGPRSHHNWGARLGRRGKVEHTEPKGLLELEALAQRTVEVMEKHSPKSEHNYHKAMDLLRLQYNLNFIVVCEKCRGPHVNDEIIAPER
ncbi:uncharacterized protein LOC113496978 [Trichoplusia ni]|uniref:Uncharacterized protein LOC113496978 n=1 Tax=Trichoplusia ni TaxID=7111 RepID=A0A7E5VV96_TRINI|nr:uncharacterized protein LOC113496978 [Trichoplusia ni]